MFVAAMESCYDECLETEGLMGKSFDAAVIGAAGVDTNIYLYGSGIDFDVEANFSDNRDYVGCAGGYSSRLFAALGKKTAFVGFFGEDFTGDYIKNEFAKDGIDFSANFTDPRGTHRSINFMYPDGRRKNFYDGKGGMETMPDLDVCRKVLERSTIAHFSIVNWTRYLLPLAREAGCIVACDLQDIVDPEDPYRHDFVGEADVLFFSAANFPDPSGLIEKFLAAKPDRIVVTGMGSRGCALGTKDGIRFFPPVDMEIPVVDTNGAGDSLAVGFLASRFLDGYSLEDSILRGQIVARHTCTLKADTSHLIGAKELDERFAKIKKG